MTRTDSSRILTCLEVCEQGLVADIKLCSGCDYYKNNVALNAMAQKKPRSQLSRYWQCTTLHNFGVVMEAVQLETPYERDRKITKYNSLNVVSKVSGDVPPSRNKRVRLFSPGDASDSSGGEASLRVRNENAPPRPSDRNALLTQRSLAIVGRDVAVAQHEKLSREHGRTLEQLNVAVKEQERLTMELSVAIVQRNQYLVERNRALSERDVALSERDVALSERDTAVCKMTLLAEQRESAVMEHRAAIVEVEEVRKHLHAISEVNSKTQASWQEMKEKQVQVVQRVAYLEALSRSASTMRVPQKPAKNKLKLIDKFASLLSPELETKDEQLNEVFEVLYGKRKKFKKFVKAKLKDEVKGVVRSETCREIKKYFAPWRILQVMDCSQQSLNQVNREYKCQS